MRPMRPATPYAATLLWEAPFCAPAVVEGEAEALDAKPDEEAELGKDCDLELSDTAKRRS